jgi:hypothetical protein
MIHSFAGGRTSVFRRKEVSEDLWVRNNTVLLREEHTTTSRQEHPKRSSFLRCVVVAEQATARSVFGLLLVCARNLGAPATPTLGVT